MNPCLQPTLFRIPAMTLVESYKQGGSYEYGRAFDGAAAVVLGPDLARQVRYNLNTFHDLGLERLDAEAAQKLRQRYGAIDHPAAREIVAWLDGEYRITREMIEAQ